MTPILVIVTFTVIILVQWYLEVRRKRLTEYARAQGPIPLAPLAAGAGRLAGFLFHPGHTWAHVHQDGLVSIGTTDFASNFAGDLSAVELPKEGRRIRQGERAWTFISTKNRRLEQTMPVDGRVVVSDGRLTTVSGDEIRQRSRHAWQAVRARMEQLP